VLIVRLTDTIAWLPRKELYCLGRGCFDKSGSLKLR